MNIEGQYGHQIVTTTPEDDIIWLNVSIQALYSDMCQPSALRSLIINIKQKQTTTHQQHAQIQVITEEADFLRLLLCADTVAIYAKASEKGHVWIW